MEQRSQNIYHWISVPIFAEISKQSEKQIRKHYKKVIQDDCIPLSEIPQKDQDFYVENLLLPDKIIDFSFLDSIKNYDLGKPLQNPEVKNLLKEMDIMRQAEKIIKAYSGLGTVTSHLQKLAEENGISYSTLIRWRKRYMNTTALTRALTNTNTNEDTNDNYRTCCLLCRDLIVYLHEQPGKISGAKIFRDIKKAPEHSCSQCPYNKEVKSKPHKKGEVIPEATCQRKSQFMIKPNNDDTVCTIIKRIPEQQDVLAWCGVRHWAALYHFAPAREKSDMVNACWFSDHKQLDIFVRTHQKPDGTWVHARPWITGIIDDATDVLVAYVLSLQPNSDCIAQCFARACAFTVDTPYAGIPDTFYIDNGADYCANSLKGLSNSPEEHLYLNKEFGESGILEWFGIKVIHALPYRGRSKTIESIWSTIDKELIKPLPGYCGSTPQERPYILDQQLKNNETYTFEQFADYFADYIYPSYNDFAVTKESPNELYKRLPKTSSYVPTWKTLAVLKSVSVERVLRPKGLKYGNNGYYWCSELGPKIEKKKKTKFRIFAFDTPFNRTISVTEDHKYIGEAHLIEKLHVVEKNRHRIIQHVKEQQAQHTFYSKRLSQLHSIVLQSNILDEVSNVPAVDHIRYAQAIDVERDQTEAIDDNNIPNELKEQAIAYEKAFLEPNTTYKPGKISQMYRQLGKTNTKDDKEDSTK